MKIPFREGKLYNGLGRIVGPWAAFSGFFFISGNSCPCCGQPACPVGGLGAGLLGAVCAFGLQMWRRLKG